MDCERLARLPCQYPKAIGSGVLVVAAIVVFLVSFGSLDPTELGLNYSWPSQSVEDKGYANGRYWLGLGHSFIKFPGTVQTIQFSDEDHNSQGGSLSSRTSDGLEVVLETSFQYQLNASSVYGLYQKYGTDYERVFTTMAMDSITTIATEFNATAFFNDRTKIGLAMEDQLQATFGDSYATIAYFQLRKTSLPHDFETAIQDTEVKRQDIQTAMAEKQNQEVQMQTKVLQAQQQAQEIAFNANATAQSTLAFVDAYVRQFKLSQELQAEGFKPIKDKLGEDQLLDYMRMRAIRDHPDQLSVVNIMKPEKK
jgi:regulator of protease activity HflC (stomatin/prohibitin superfamily)